MKNKILIFLFLFMVNTAWLFANKHATLDCSSFFTWEQVPGTNGIIQFSNQSTGQFNTWMWDFGDGTTSGQYSPEHQFTEFGIYYVCLTISDGASCNDTYCDTVIVLPDCQANFDITYVPTTPAMVQFTDLSSGYPDSWLWFFGDGTSSTEQNPVHAYYDPGIYEVCLIIEHSDSLYTCSDSICKTVFIPDSLDCEAFFTYESDEDDPLELQFFDESVGNITEWEWDFGDGSISHEQNPVHIYDQGGEYLVCLKVENSDTSSSCLHFLCETIILNDSVLCQSDFIAEADSSSHTMYKYSFIDKSSGNPDGWLWDFGDGNYSQEQNPVHVYDEAGTYEICLNSWNSNHPGCTDTYCSLVKTANYFQLGGLAFIGENPLNNPYPTGDTGVAILYRQRENNSLVAIDTNTFHELGYYWFSNMMELNYLVRISLSPGSVHFKDYIPSYFPGSMSWHEADAFMLNDNLFEMNLAMVHAIGADIGFGRIAGRVVFGNKYGVEANHSFHEIPVILTDQYSVPLEWTLTDEYGQFEFNDLAFGSYLLHADVAGIWSQAEIAVISEDYPVLDTALIKMFNSSPFSIQEPDQQEISIGTIYPNPVSVNMSLQFNAKSTLNLQLSLFNMTGQVVYSTEYYAVKGSNTVIIPTENIPGGLYLVGLKWNGEQQMITKKFIKN